MQRQPRKNRRPKQPRKLDCKCFCGTAVNSVEMMPQPTFFLCLWQVSQPVSHRGSKRKKQLFCGLFCTERNVRHSTPAKAQKNNQEKAIFTLDKCLDIDFIQLLKFA